jgi:hypothetical protein
MSDMLSSLLLRMHAVLLEITEQLMNCLVDKSASSASKMPLVVE